jgi:hypothetical protein
VVCDRTRPHAEIAHKVLKLEPGKFDAGLLWIRVLYGGWLASVSLWRLSAVAPVCVRPGPGVAAVVIVEQDAASSGSACR